MCVRNALGPWSLETMACSSFESEMWKRFESSPTSISNVCHHIFHLQHEARDESIRGLCSSMLRYHGVTQFSFAFPFPSRTLIKWNAHNQIIVVSLVRFVFLLNFIFVHYYEWMCVRARANVFDFLPFNWTCKTKTIFFFILRYEYSYNVPTSWLLLLSMSIQ